MKPIRCWFGCSCQTNEDETGIWGECVRCHRRYGFTSREDLRRYIDAEEAEVKRLVRAGVDLQVAVKAVSRRSARRAGQ